MVGKQNLKKTKAVLILSGGMDSTTLLYDIVKKYGCKNVLALSFYYNQKHKCELLMAVKTCKKLGVFLKILSLEVLNEVAPSALTRKNWKVPLGHYASNNMKQTVVANRNLVMLSIAASFAMSRKIKYLYYGAHGGDHTIYPDTRPEFVKATIKVLELADWQPLRLRTPYLYMNKTSILKRGLKLGVDYSLTHTCYAPNSKRESCGSCGSCTERLEAFTKNNVKDPIVYIRKIKRGG